MAEYPVGAILNNIVDRSAAQGANLIIDLSDLGYSL